MDNERCRSLAQKPSKKGTDLGRRQKKGRHVVLPLKRTRGGKYQAKERAVGLAAGTKRSL